MGREIRRVPATWQHPKDENGKYQPMHDRSFSAAFAEYERERAAWERGEFPDYASEESKRLTFVEWEGEPPDPAYYVPEWPAEERTHWQMYENTSEGTPISPVFATPEECARWCADHGASAFGDDTASYEWWLRVAEGSAGHGLMVRIENGSTTMEVI